MRLLLVAFIIGSSISAGCSTTPPYNPWEGLTTETESAVASLDCGSFPYPSEHTNVGVVYDSPGVNALEAYRVCSESNEANVDEHASQIMQLKIARQRLTDAGQAQLNISTMRAEMLEDERKYQFWLNIGQWILIIGMAI